MVQLYKSKEDKSDSLLRVQDSLHPFVLDSFGKGQMKNGTALHQLSHYLRCDERGKLIHKWGTVFELELGLLRESRHQAGFHNEGKQVR